MALIFLAAFVIAFAQSVNAEPYQSECPDGDACELWDRFEGKYGNSHISVKWDSACGCIRELYGWYEISESEVSKGEAKALAMDFLSENAELLGIDAKQLKFRGIKGGAAVYEQYYRNVPVYGGVVTVVMDTKEGRTYVSAIGNNFYQGINVPTKPDLTKEQVVEIITGMVGVTLSDESIAQRVEKMSLYIVAGSTGDETSYHLAWMAPMHNLYFVDSTTGEVVRAEVSPTSQCPLGYDCILIAESNLEKYWKILVIAILFLALPPVLWKRRGAGKKDGQVD